MLPNTALTVLNKLTDAGFEAYAVGGCVRDMLRGLPPADIDITTNAMPEQTMEVFAGFRVIPTGLQHGTVTVLLEDEPFEITTYRTDGTYSDSRHPDSVSFTTSLTEDLARRDFTINAMAFHPQTGVIDPFGGQEDLKSRRIRCVGDPEKRFTEDALRIARMTRFMSVLDFDADPATADAAHKLVARLDAVAAERKRVELMKTLAGNGFLRTAEAFADVLCRIVPALSPLCGFEQHNPHHSFDVYTHTVRAVQLAAKDSTVRLAVLFHDLGKPQTFFTDENGIGHFYGHPEVSEALACEAMRELRFDNATIQAVLPLVANHDKPIHAERRHIKRWLSRLGKESLLRLLEVKAADASACHADSIPPDLSAVRQLIEEIVEAEDCVDLHKLAVNGNDLLQLGIPAGPQLGEALNFLFEEVLSERCSNDREALLCLVKERFSNE